MTKNSSMQELKKSDSHAVTPLITYQNNMCQNNTKKYIISIKILQKSRIFALRFKHFLIN